MKTRTCLIVFAAALHIFGYYALYYRIEPFQYYFYITSWWSYVILVDAIAAMRRKSFLILNRHLARIIFVSCAFWCFFELINLRIGNWSYVNLPQGVLRRYLSFTIAFGTVIPAIYATEELIYGWIGDIKVRPVIISRWPSFAIPVGLGLLIAVFSLPRYFFAATWVFLALVLDGYNYLCGYSSFMKDLEDGSLSRLVATAASGLLCGMLWEAWNYWSIAKWVYTVPFFAGFKVFEMPLLGYLGFLAFGIETMALVNFLQGSGISRKHPYPVLVYSILFSLATFPLIDCYTVTSIVNPGR